MNITAPLITCVLSGAEASLADLPLVLSSFSLIKLSGAPSYYRAVTPANAGIEEQILLRPDGALTVYLDGVEWEHFTPSSTLISEGATSRSTSFSGERQTTNTAPATVYLDGRAYREFVRLRNGQYELQGVPWVFGVKPSDTVVYDGSSYSCVRVSTQLGVGAFKEILTLKVTP